MAALLAFVGADLPADDSAGTAAAMAEVVLRAAELVSPADLALADHALRLTCRVWLAAPAALRPALAQVVGEALLPAIMVVVVVEGVGAREPACHRASAMLVSLAAGQGHPQGAPGLHFDALVAAVQAAGVAAAEAVARTTRESSTTVLAPAATERSFHGAAFALGQLCRAAEPSSARAVLAALMREAPLDSPVRVALRLPGERATDSRRAACRLCSAGGS